ncbi:MAG: GDYXXLXY domain-containing protein [Moraxellaceae bacterium]|nr:GDYXXLXY domain-containing protein [Moraxellaceae bacterium]
MCGWRSKMRKYMVLVMGLCILGAVNMSIWHKEQLLANGKTVFLALAPVDPRSLMQGDYMALRFKLEQDITPQLTHDKTQNADGYVVVNVNAQGIGEFVQLQDNLANVVNPQQIAMRYRVREGKIKFATNAFFFEEGKSDLYAQARYGEFKVAANGELLLKDLRGENLVVLSKTRL